MAYTTIDKPSDYFNTKLYTGNNNITQTISGVGFQPDWVWIKNRDNVENHYLFDAVRGSGKILMSHNTNAEADLPINTKPTIASDGFTLTSNGSNDELNFGTRTYVSWNWLAGTSFTNDASSTGIGTIDSTGSVSDTAGFSIVSYTGTGSNATVKHGLSSAPAMIIVKSRSNVDSWYVYHKGIGNTVAIFLDDTSATSASSTYWQNTNPTSSVFSIGTGNAVNRSGGTFIAYCFAEKQGYSKFGSYTGNGNADGTFVYTGFKPAWVMLKRTDTAKSWLVLDNKRNTFNPYNTELSPNLYATEATNIRFDSLSNGFKLRLASGASNASGGNYIYMAFAENPFVSSTGVPATAR